MEDLFVIIWLPYLDKQYNMGSRNKNNNKTAE